MEKKAEIEFAAVRPAALALAKKFARASRLDLDPEDVAQEVCLRMWTAHKSGAQILNAEAWAVSTTKNLCISLLRKSRARTFAPLSESLPSAESAASSLDETESARKMEYIMDQISRGTRQLLSLRSAGMSLDEISAVTGRTKGSVKSSISQARKQIMEMIERY